MAGTLEAPMTAGAQLSSVGRLSIVKHVPVCYPMLIDNSRTSGCSKMPIWLIPCLVFVD